MIKDKTKRKEYMRQWLADHPDYHKTSKSIISRDRYIKSNKGSKTRKQYSVSPKGKYSLNKCFAAKRGISFDISYEQFMEYWQKPCHYCGDNIQTIGMDRIDSNKGYLVGNILPCCTPCNTAKLSGTYQDYIDRCHRVSILHPCQKK